MGGATPPSPEKLSVHPLALGSGRCRCGPSGPLGECLAWLMLRLTTAKFSGIISLLRGGVEEALVPSELQRDFLFLSRGYATSSSLCWDCSATVPYASITSHSLMLRHYKEAFRVAIMLAFTRPTKMSPCCPCITPPLLFPAAMTTSVLLLLLLSLSGTVALAVPQQQQQELQLQDTVLLDDVVQEAAEEWYHGRHRRTGVAYPLSLPGSLSGVDATVARFRAGSLQRYGVRRFGEFSLPQGLAVRGRAAAHLIAVRVNLGNLSSVYDEYAVGAGYRLASPVLGLMFYGLARRNGTAALQIDLTGAAIRVNFSVAIPALQPGGAALCLAVGLNGSVTVTDVEEGTNTCNASDQGHFALVVGGAGDGGGSGGGGAGEADIGEVSKWKLALFGAALGAGGTVLLGMVAVAVVSIQRRKSEMAEMERRAYEEEALRVSMVGHVRAPSAAGSRTTPDELESEYCATL
ncbi:unnamed protein product [Miscanthus lutarioriparius]|uniref:Uncharacterized protein n=2 Tax=PACMAD clade TaxID=147370 RepID=A0A811QZH0_9POAL|nr:unnamed protein product [Miscanthus lutarioriparius]